MTEMLWPTEPTTVIIYPLLKREFANPGLSGRVSRTVRIQLNLFISMHMII